MERNAWQAVRHAAAGLCRRLPAGAVLQRFQGLSTERRHAEDLLHHRHRRLRRAVPGGARRSGGGEAARYIRAEHKSSFEVPIYESFIERIELQPPNPDALTRKP